MKKTMALILTAAMVLLPAADAHAMKVTFETGKKSFQAVNLQGEQSKVKTASFQLIGKDASDNYIVFARKAFYRVNAAELEKIYPPAGDAELLQEADFETLSRGSRGDAVENMQKALISLGYLNGGADGSFGNQSTQAVSAFQKEVGLEETGEADALLQLLILSAAAPEVVVTDPSASFKPIAGMTDVDLATLYEAGLVLDFDDISGTGFISSGTPAHFEFPAETDIDKGEMDVWTGLYVFESEEGHYEMQPAVKVICSAARRLMLQNVQVKAGTKRSTGMAEQPTVTVEGAMTLEEGLALLDEKGAEVFAAAAESGELKIRVNGKYRNFDLAAGKETLAGLTAAGQAVK